MEMQHTKTLPREIWIGYNIQLAELIYECASLLLHFYAKQLDMLDKTDAKK